MQTILTTIQIQVLPTHKLSHIYLGADGIYTSSADDKLFVEMAYQYARAHTNMWKTGRRCGLSAEGDSFYHGITNGAGWYHLSGGMQVSVTFDERLYRLCFRIGSMSTRTAWK